jgi:hypothetical protein
MRLSFYVLRVLCFGGTYVGTRVEIRHLGALLRAGFHVRVKSNDMCLYVFVATLCIYACVCVCRTK